MAIVERGYPRGVSAAPRPIEKHAIIMRFILDFRERGIALTTSTRIIATRIAEHYTGRSAKGNDEDESQNSN
jgi:hypothetical protein